MWSRWYYRDLEVKTSQGDFHSERFCYVIQKHH